jgi:hypothetical protein
MGMKEPGTGRMCGEEQASEEMDMGMGGGIKGEGGDGREEAKRRACVRVGERTEGARDRGEKEGKVAGGCTHVQTHPFKYKLYRARICARTHALDQTDSDTGNYGPRGGQGKLSAEEGV